MGFADVYAVDKVTIYGYTSNEWGERAFSVKGVISCEYESGGDMQRDSVGEQFIPASTIYPASGSIAVERGDKVALGDTSSESTPPKTAETVKKVSFVTDYFSSGKDAVIYTG